MVTLFVPTTSNPTSINPVNAFLAMPAWQPGPISRKKRLTEMKEAAKVLSITKCGVLMQCIEKLATRYPATKFVKII
ncbi:hypothetical protein HN51_021312 [Arachis hypogaea]